MAQRIVTTLERLHHNLGLDEDEPPQPDRPYPRFPDTDNGPSTNDPDSTLALVLPLLILLSTLLFLLLVFLLFLVVVRRRRGGFLGGRGGIRLGLDEGPVDLGRDDESWAEGEGGVEGMESRYLDGLDEEDKSGYVRAKIWQSQYPPNSLPTDITLSQFLSIQEKGVSAWAFEPDYDSNPSLPVFVQSRTEITFLADGAGMAPEEGGGVCVQSNLPLPKLNEVYYWECKMYEKPASTNISIGLATKPYPSFRLPGWNRMSIGYFSDDGFKSHNYPFTATSYGPPLTEGDVLGVGYRPRTGAVFYTRNGKKLEDAYIGLNKYNVFPTIGADGAAMVHVNLGQAGFVFIEANVKKWGLAPMAGTLAPPPAYGHQTGSILLAAAASTRDATPREPSMPAVSEETEAEEDWAESSSNTSLHRRVSGRTGADVRPVAGRVEAARPAVPSPLRTEAVTDREAFRPNRSRQDSSAGNVERPGSGASGK